MSHFDLLVEPWIPATDQRGRTEPYGLLTLLERAKELQAIAEPSPAMRFGLYRFLSAFLLDALQPETLADLADLLEVQNPPMDRLRAYVERVGPRRFDLFDAETPFYQVPRSALAANAEPKSLADLIQHLPAGINPVHFLHMQEVAHALAPGPAARALLALAPFATSAGAGYSPAVNGAPPWYTLVVGQNLWETLLLNIPRLDQALDKGDSPPAWRAQTPVLAKEERTVGSLLAGLTWQPRQVHLLLGEGGTCTYTGEPSAQLVRSIYFGPGLKAGAAEGWTDPSVAYQRGAKISPLRPREDREVWRDTGPLILLREADYQSADGKVCFSAPAVVRQVAYLQELGAIPWSRPLVVEVFGLRTDKAKIFEWQHERLALPAGIAGQATKTGFVQVAMEQADSISYYLGVALKKAYPRGGAGNKAAFARVIQSVRAGFWAKLQPYFQEEFLERVAAWDSRDPERQAALQAEWNQQLRSLGTATLEQGLTAADSFGETGVDAGLLARHVEARGLFRAALVRLLEPHGKERPAKKGGRAG